MLDFDPDAYWDERGGEKYAQSVAVPEFMVHLHYQQEWLSKVQLTHNPKILLDLGCGVGSMFVCWKRVNEVFAYDRSRTMLHQARVLARQKGYGYKIISPDSASRVQTPYKDEMFDFVAMATVLAHVMPSDLKGFAQEVRRISKPGAVWAIITAVPFDDERLEYMWDHDYGEFFGEDVKLLDDHNFGPYRYIEAVYDGPEGSAKAGGVEAVSADISLQGVDV